MCHVPGYMAHSARSMSASWHPCDLKFGLCFPSGCLPRLAHCADDGRSIDDWAALYPSPQAQMRHSAANVHALKCGAAIGSGGLWTSLDDSRAGARRMHDRDVALANSQPAPGHINRYNTRNRCSSTSIHCVEQSRIFPVRAELLQLSDCESHVRRSPKSENHVVQLQSTSTSGQFCACPRLALWSRSLMSHCPLTLTLPR